MVDKNVLEARSTTLEVKLHEATLPTHAGRNEFVDADMPANLRGQPSTAGQELGNLHFQAVLAGARAFVAASGAPAGMLKELQAPSRDNHEIALAA
jgi:hypothetical protein